MVEGIGQKPREIVYVPTKVNKPSLIQRSIPRKELLDKFDRGIPGVLTTVVSPAGFGKTTSVLAWTNAHSGIPVAWYLLNEEDRDIDRFWQYFTASMRIADKSLCHALDEIRLSDDFSTIRPVLDVLLFELAEYGDEFIFVLEDFHTVHDCPSIHESMAYFLKHLPLNAHVVITSRQTLRLPLNKMKVEGLLNEIVESDLRFSTQEIHDYFMSLGYMLSEERCQAIFESTRGWPTGSKLIALRYGQGSEQKIDDAILLAKNSINDYLFEEVFAGLPGSLQHFLLATSTVSSFSLSLAETITGLSQEETVEAIDLLVSNDLFIEKIERKGGKDWYRYHLLFAEMLHQRLERVDRGKVYEMRLAARDWFDERGYLDYVVEVSTDLKDFDKIKQILLENWKTLYMNDSHFVLLRWTKDIPLEEILERPMLCAILTMPYAIKGDFEKANSFIEHAMSRLHDSDDFLFAFCMAQKTYISYFANDISAVSSYVAAALKYLPEKEYYLRGMMTQLQASTWVDTDPLRAKQAFLQMLDVQIPLGNKGLSCSLYCTLAWICANLGHLEEASHYCRLAFSLFDEQERMFKPMLSYAYLANMVVSYQRGLFEEVLGAFKFSQATSVDGAVPTNSAEAISVFAKTKFALNNGEGEKDFFKAMSMNEAGALLCLPSLPMAKAYYDAFKTASQERVAFRTEKKQTMFFDLEVAYYSAPKEFYKKACDFAEGIDPEERLLRLSSLLLCAAYAEACGFTKQADAYGIKALCLMRATGLHQPLYENISELEPVIKRVANQVVDASDIVVINEALARARVGNPAIDLTQRELDVMHLIASGLTIQETAQSLFVSRDTVKKHLANIYAKLGVHSKLDAVTVLRDNNML